MTKKSVYITTTLPYVNSDPHIGFAMEIIRADIIARYKKLMGYEVFFNTGTDEHGMKIFEAAKKSGKETKKYVDEYAQKFQELKALLDLSSDIHFIRTTDPHHEKAAQEFWKRVEKNGYIYKKNYKTKYCIGCESEKTDSELVDGKCPIHPLVIQILEEENYFFKFSKFGEKLLALYKKNPKLVIPDFRFNEVKAFVEGGLDDFSISRLKTKMPWGVPVPGDDSQVMYVWTDALVSYISTLGWPDDKKTFEKFWVKGETIQYCGKDNTRFQAVMWQAMLMAADLPNTSTVVVNGFVTGEGGVKMSKSAGNAVNPMDIVNEYGAESLRLFVSKDISPFEDSPFTMERFKASYNANLANGLGNLVSRIMKLAETHLSGSPEIPDDTIPKNWKDALEEFDIKKAADIVWEEIGNIDATIQTSKPFQIVKSDKEEGKKLISELVVRLYTIARMLDPFLGETSEKIKSLIKENRMPKKSLFPRKD